MAHRSHKFSEEEIVAINEVAVPENTKKATNFGLLVFTGRWKIIFSLNLLQNYKNGLTSSPKCL